jgi:hypothetical protein
LEFAFSFLVCDYGRGVLKNTLAQEAEMSEHHHHHDASHHLNTDKITWKDYLPLTTILSLILVVVGSIAIKDISTETFSLAATMTNFMAAFFLVFAGFKFLDLKGFQEGYASYDLIAARWPVYGLIYPFIEFGLGLAYLTRFAPDFTNILTFGIMLTSSFGVINSLRQNRKFQCACLGTIIKVPLTYVTLVEDLTMTIMAAAMLLM